MNFERDGSIWFYKINKYNSSKRIELEETPEICILFENIEYDDNIWGASIQHKIFVTENGDFGYFKEIPGGYSEYTYDPETITYVYKSKFNDLQKDWEYFYSYGLDLEFRDMINKDSILEKLKD